MASFEKHLQPEQPPRLPEAPVRMSKANPQIDNMELKAIAQLAYEHWEARGRPWGSPDEDWFRAELEIKRSREFAW